MDEREEFRVRLHRIQEHGRRQTCKSKRQHRMRAPRSFSCALRFSPTFSYIRTLTFRRSRASASHFATLYYSGNADFRLGRSRFHAPAL